MTRPLDLHTAVCIAGGDQGYESRATSAGSPRI
jgi:hypothetical protein